MFFNSRVTAYNGQTWKRVQRIHEIFFCHKPWSHRKPISWVVVCIYSIWKHSTTNTRCYNRTVKVYFAVNTNQFHTDIHSTQIHIKMLWNCYKMLLYTEINKPSSTYTYVSYVPTCTLYTQTNVMSTHDQVNGMSECTMYMCRYIYI